MVAISHRGSTKAAHRSLTGPRGEFLLLIGAHAPKQCKRHNWATPFLTGSASGALPPLFPCLLVNETFVCNFITNVTSIWSLLLALHGLMYYILIQCYHVLRELYFCKFCECWRHREEKITIIKFAGVALGRCGSETDVEPMNVSWLFQEKQR